MDFELMTDSTLVLNSSFPTVDVHILIIDDTIQEDNKTFIITLTLLMSGVVVDLNTSTIEITIVDDDTHSEDCLLYTSPSPRDATLSRMPSSA